LIRWSSSEDFSSRLPRFVQPTRSRTLCNSFAQGGQWRNESDRNIFSHIACIGPDLARRAAWRCQALRCCCLGKNSGLWHTLWSSQVFFHNPPCAEKLARSRTFCNSLCSRPKAW
jgi:hypothetical protein